MARTAVVNPRRRKRRKSNPKRSHKRRRNYGAALVAREPNRRRARRRRTYGARRRRNPSGGSYLARAQNPGGLGFDQTIDIVPAATAGVWAARWAVAQAGEMEDGEPGIKHALAIWLAASFGGQLIGSVFGDSKTLYAQIGALAFGGDLFLRKRFLKDSEWAKKNISLGDDDSVAIPAGGTYVDAMNNTWVETPDGWALAGMGDDSQLYEDSQGNVYQLGNIPGTYGAGFGAFENASPLGAFENASPLGGARASSESSFGYA